MIRNDPKLGQGLTLEGRCLYLSCPTWTNHWDKHNLFQWDRQIGTSCACPSVLVPVGQAQLVCVCCFVLLLTDIGVPTGTRKGQMRPLLVPWDKSYSHAGGLSLSRDNLYTHDGACPRAVKKSIIEFSLVDAQH